MLLHLSFKNCNTRILMRIKSTLLTLGLSAIALTACQTASSPSTVKGKWSFNTLQGDYAELWMDDQSLLTVRSDSRNPYVFDYIHNGDTIILYEKGQRGDKKWEASRFLIEEQNDTLIKILQNTIHNELHLISKDPGKIKNIQSYRDSVLLDFDSRAQSEQ